MTPDQIGQPNYNGFSKGWLGRPMYSSARGKARLFDDASCLLLGLSAVPTRPTPLPAQAPRAPSLRFDSTRPQQPGRRPDSRGRCRRSQFANGRCRCVPPSLASRARARASRTRCGPPSGYLTGFSSPVVPLPAARRPGAKPRGGGGGAGRTSAWLAADGSKRWGEAFFLLYTPFWLTLCLGVVVPFKLYEVAPSHLAFMFV